MATGMISVVASDTVTLTKDYAEREFPWFLVNIGHCSLQVDENGLDVAEQIANRLLEGVALVRAYQATRQPVEPLTEAEV
jgi:hypothetical protein